MENISADRFWSRGIQGFAGYRLDHSFRGRQANNLTDCSGRGLLSAILRGTETQTCERAGYDTLRQEDIEQCIFYGNGAMPARRMRSGTGPERWKRR
jgi:hypothetical protein